MRAPTCAGWSVQPAGPPLSKKGGHFFATGLVEDLFGAKMAPFPRTLVLFRVGFRPPPSPSRPSPSSTRGDEGATNVGHDKRGASHLLIVYPQRTRLFPPAACSAMRETEGGPAISLILPHRPLIAAMREGPISLMHVGPLMPPHGPWQRVYSRARERCGAGARPPSWVGRGWARGGGGLWSWGTPPSAGEGGGGEEGRGKG